MKWKGRGVVAFVLFVCVCVCMCVCWCVCMCVYDDLSTYLTKRTFSRFLSLLFLFLYLANQSTYLPTYLTYLTFYLEIFFSRILFFSRIFFLGGIYNRIVPISNGII